jgi:hypothetical protein
LASCHELLADSSSFPQADCSPFPPREGVPFSMAAT